MIQSHAEFIDEWDFADVSPSKKSPVHYVDLKDLKPGFKLDLIMEHRISTQEGMK
jgi:hypothetical protein